MFGDRPAEFPQLISFLLVPGFSLFGLTAMLDPLRHANRTSNRELYRWQLISEQGGLVESSDALEIMMAGGTLVGVGTAIYYHGDEFWAQATDEMQTWLNSEGVKNISEIVGAFHKS
mgnify:CR=1 FL=1